MVACLLVFAYALGLHGCVENAPALDDRDRPQPMGGESVPMGGTPDACPDTDDVLCVSGELSDQPCAADEESCQTVERPDACNGPLFCRQPLNCPAIDPSCPDGFEACGNLNDPECQTIEVGDEPCEQLISCREMVVCPAIAYMCPEETRSCDPDSEPNCTERTFGTGRCIETLYCTPVMACAEPTCTDEERQSDRACIEGEPDCRRVKACDEVVYCRIASQCQAEPVCQAEQQGSDRPCDADEPGCEPVFECGNVIFCRETMMCDVLPMCGSDEIESRQQCRDDEPDCRRVEACGSTVYCRVDASCDGLPECRPTEDQTILPCRDGEAECRVVEVCGVREYCRPPVEMGLLTLESCERVNLPVDVFTIDNAVVEGDILRMNVSASGGCESHDFVGCQRPVIPAEPTQFRITLGHNANGDQCEGIINEELAFDLRPLRDIYLMMIGEQDRQMSLFITDYAMPLIYRF